MSKYGEDIRRISRYEQLLKLINEAKATADQAEKDALLGSRSIAYLDPTTLATSAKNGAINVTQPTNGGVTPGGPVGTGLTSGTSGAVSGAGDLLNSLNNTGSSSSLGSGSNNDKQGVYDAASLLNNTADAYGKEPPLDGETIGQITGLQTADGSRGIVVGIKDALTAFMGPSDWTTPISPGVDPTYTPGIVYHLYGAYANSIKGVLAASAPPGFSWYGITNGNLDGTNFLTSFSPSGDPGTYMLLSANPGAYLGRLVINQGGDIFGPIATYAMGTQTSIGAMDCGLTSDSNAACAAAPPLQSAWSDLGVTQLAWLSPLTGVVPPYSLDLVGRFIPNPFDVNVPTQYQNGSSILDLKTIGGDTVRIGPLANGGKYMYFSNPSNSNLPTGSTTANSVYTINGDRTPGGFITPNQLATMLPK